MESTAHLNFNKDSEYWIAAYTRPRSEKKAAKELYALGVEVYLPIQTQMRRWSDRKKKVEVVVIPMVIFAKVNNETLDKVKQHPLILNPISFPGKKEPAPIPNVQIEQLKFILGQSDIPVDYDPNIVKVNDSVRVTRGKLMGLCGEVKSCSDSLYELIVQIDLLGGAKLIIPKTDVDVIKR